MKHYNIYNNSEPGLENFSDNRGTIADIFFKQSINHGCIITNSPGAVRGNHYHKLTTQYTYILSGSLDYYSKPVDSAESAKVVTAGVGDFVISEPMEIHAMKSGQGGCTFIAFASGTRGGEDYESDTTRVDSIIPL
jgi:oxalate decarboxylase/phosphoglucose isomerase-like protein (cupin superfamily)